SVARYPDHSAGRRVQTENLGLLMQPARAGPGVDALAHHLRTRVHADVPLKIPALLPRDGIHAKESLVSCAEEDPAIGDTRRRLNVPGGFKVPKLLAHSGVQAIEFAREVLVHPLADIEPAVR